MCKRASVLGVYIDCLTMRQAVDKIEKFILSGRPNQILTANTEMVMFAQKDDDLAQILETASLVVPDGAGVVWAAKRSGQNMRERIAGYDLMQRILDLAAKRGYRVFLLGSKPEVVEAAKQKAAELYPGVKIVGVWHGFFDEDEESGIIESIKNAQPDILFAALGVPKQEKWLFKYLHILNVPVCMGVGGSFDVMAGFVRRAPLWMQNANLEWFYRLLQQPERLVRMAALPRFVFKVVLSNLFHK